MKITKTKEVVTEEIEVQPGEYYFEDEYAITRKVIIEESSIDYIGYTMETLHHRIDNFGIRIVKEGAWDKNDLPYEFRRFILEEAGIKLKKEEFYFEKQNILKRLTYNA